MVSDGNLVLPVDFLFPDVPGDQLQPVLEAANLGADGTLAPDCNVTLVKSGDRTILFDVGAGPNFMPSAGTLLDNLDAQGIDPASITDVVFTHAHPDHLWGLIDDFDELIFSQAAYHMNRIEWDYWRADDTLDKIPDARKSFVVGAQNRFGYLEDRIELFDYGAEVVPGIEAVNTSGHTPGHTSFAVHDGSQNLMIVGDALTNHVLSFQYPDWPSGSDQDPEQGRKTRTQLLDRLAGDGTTLIGFHMPHPGIGNVERTGDRYIFNIAEAN